MKLQILILITILTIFTSYGVAQQIEDKKSNEIILKPMDVTEAWKYPYSASEEKRNKLLSLLDDFEESITVSDLFKRLGEPDRIDDLVKETKPLSHFESGFTDRTKGQFAYRFIWFARKASKLPGLSDSWLAAYVDNEGKTVTVIHNNWLKR